MTTHKFGRVLFWQDAVIASPFLRAKPVCRQAGNLVSSLGNEIASV